MAGPRVSKGGIALLLAIFAPAACGDSEKSPQIGSSPSSGGAGAAGKAGSSGSAGASGGQSTTGGAQGNAGKSGTGGAAGIGGESGNAGDGGNSGSAGSSGDGGAGGSSAGGEGGAGASAGDGAGGAPVEPCPEIVVNATCNMTPTGCDCSCNSGYEGDQVICTDIDECLVDNGGCAEKCSNAPGSFSCDPCDAGTGLSPISCTMHEPTYCLSKQLRITEVMANQSGVEGSGAGEFVEILNVGQVTVDLTELYIDVGPIGGTMSRDAIVSSESPWLPPGKAAVVLDRDYDSRYSLEFVHTYTVSDASFGAAGIATTHAVTLVDTDGVTVLDRFQYPSDPGDGVTLHRMSLTAPDAPSNWVPTSCGASPGWLSCSAGDATSFISYWADQNDGDRFWHQVIGWPSWSTPACDGLLVCGAGNYYDNFAAPAPFDFTNPYADFDVVFAERASATDACSDPCSNESFTIPAGSSGQVPASSLGYYMAYTSGSDPASADWGGSCQPIDLPPDGLLPPFIVEVP